MPLPFWLIGAVVFVVQMSSTQPSFYKRLTLGLLFATSLCTLLFIVVMSSVGAAFDTTGLIVTMSVMLPIQALLMAGFVAAADMAFRAAFGPLSWDLGKMRDLRGVHLGLNLAGMFVFPIFTFIGVPLTLGKVARHRRNHKGLFGWSVACGTLTLLVTVVVILLAVITAGTTPIEYPGPEDVIPCRKRSVLQITGTDMDATTIGMDTTASNSTTTSAFAWDTTTTSTFNFTSDTDTNDFTSDVPWACGVRSSNAWTVSSMFGPAWNAVGQGWNPNYYSRYYSNMLQQPDVIIAVVSLCLFAWAFHLTFIILADQIILKNIEGGTAGQVSGVVISQAPSAVAQQLVHPCASCGTQLQFVRTGPTTQVQCFQCRAIVEFTTA